MHFASTLAVLPNLIVRPALELSMLDHTGRSSHDALLHLCSPIAEAARKFLSAASGCKGGEIPREALHGTANSQQDTTGFSDGCLDPHACQLAKAQLSSFHVNEQRSGQAKIWFASKPLPPGGHSQPWLLVCLEMSFGLAGPKAATEET